MLSPLSRLSFGKANTTASSSYGAKRPPLPSDFEKGFKLLENVMASENPISTMIRTSMEEIAGHPEEARNLKIAYNFLLLTPKETRNTDFHNAVQMLSGRLKALGVTDIQKPPGNSIVHRIWRAIAESFGKLRQKLARLFISLGLKMEKKPRFP